MQPQTAVTKRELSHGALIGVDPGTNRAPSGIAVAEVEWRTLGERRDTHFHVRHLETLPAGLRYPDLADRLAEIFHGIGARGHTVWTRWLLRTTSYRASGPGMRVL